MSDFSDLLRIPESAAADLRRSLGLKASDPLRVTYFAGVGDVAGTFGHWSAGSFDPRVPIVTYSLMLYELMKQLDAQCQVIGHHPVGDLANSPDSRFRFENVTALPFSGRWSYLRRQRRLARDLVSMVRQFDPHVVITSTHDPTAAWPGLTRGRKLVLSAHNTFWPMGHPPQGIKGQVLKAALASHAKALDGAICVSHEAAQQVAELTNGRVRAEEQCPQIVDRYPVEERNRLRRLLYLGRIEYNKGVFLLVDVFEKLAGVHPDLTLVLAGSGGAEDALRARLAESPVADRITFRGRIGSDEVHAAIADTDMLVCPTMTTFSEGLAVVGFEAAAHGIPSVLSSVVPAADHLGESCKVYEADNAEALRATLSALIDDPESYRALCAATASVREQTYDRSLSWGSGLFRALMQ